MTILGPPLETGLNPSGGACPEGRELAMLHHDLRGALQGVICGIGRIRAADLPDQVRGDADRVAAAARSVANLVGALLGDTAFLRPSGQVVELADLLAYLRCRHGGEARQRGLTLEVLAGAGLPLRLRLDATSLTRILDNLIGNAIEFAGRGAVRLALAREPDGAVAFRVLDDGPGLTAAAIEAAFGQGPRQAPLPPGHGLGLQIVRSLTDRLGGTVSILNRSGGGVEAVLRFPPELAVEACPGERDGAAALAGRRILLAEDNPTNQMVASQMLRALDAEVIVCADGVEALERFEVEPVDLVIVDIEMPRLSGLDVIRAIRARGDARAGVPIVALTAYAMREHRERIAAAGANGLIAKPITSIEALGRELAAYVAPRRVLAARALEPSVEAHDLVIDLAVFEALCDAVGKETMAELIDKVIADLSAAQADLAAGLDGLDRVRIRSASHILVSVAGALGAVRLQASARALNTVAHTDAPDRIADGVRRCVGEIDAALAIARGQRAAG
jgi:two-component system aerobic respiration control sensor histidine kinase ArcB